MSKHVISCFPSGVAEAVLNDEVPLHLLGKSQMTRASDVEWDDGIQLWVATIRPEFRQEGKDHTFAHESRSVCIEWELEYLNDR